MAQPLGNSPTVDGLWIRPFQVIADDATPATVGDNAIPPYIVRAEVYDVTNDANDWVVLPSLADCPNGHEILILCNAGSNFELRTPASSNEKINTVDSDGSQEYLCTDTDYVRVVKLSDTDGWVAQSIQADGAVRTAVTPD